MDKVGTNDNQEDSLIFNRSSIERGKFSGKYLKKYIISVQKNQSTSQDDIFMKPDPSKVINMKHGSYDKLNDKGYAPQETRLENNDAIFGKVTPITDTTDSGKHFKDSSELFKMNGVGVVDRVYIDVQNQDGYSTRQALIRSKKVPHIGDKYSCYDDKTDILTTDGWVNFKELTMQHKVATLANDKLKYQSLSKIHKYDFDGLMYCVTNDQVNLMVTPNHRMWVRAEHDNKYGVMRADEINGNMYYRKNALNPVKQDEYAVLNTDSRKVIFEAFVRMFAIFFQTGCVTENKTLEFEIRNPIILRTLQKACITMNIALLDSSMKSVNNTIISNDDDIVESYYIDDPDIVKFLENVDYNHLPSWVWELDQKHANILTFTMIKACGSNLINAGSIALKSTLYTTTSKSLADDFQRLCLHAGYSSNIKTGGKITTYMITVNDTDEYCAQSQDEFWTQYTGQVYCCTVENDSTGTDENSGIVYVRREGKPVWSGNSRHGQKGTIGILFDDVDMPFNKYGVKPDIILNPNAIPSRMTIGQLFECLVGKAAALQGMDADGTAFEEHDIEDAKNTLEKLGYERNGYEYLYNGMTGEKMLHQIFIGPTFYQRLKHLVEDKIHSRARGPKTSLTRQAPEGRARDGGLKLGEMERDALLAHGLAKFIKEKLLDNSDAYTTYVCDKCGLFAQRYERKENKAFATDNDIYHCPACKNHTDISKIRIPYAFKLFVHEMMAMCIAPRIRCNKTIYNS